MVNLPTEEVQQVLSTSETISQITDTYQSQGTRTFFFTTTNSNKPRGGADI